MMKAKRHLVVGGQSSGKSAWAEGWMLANTPEWINPVIMCPCEPFDDAMRARIDRHQAVRHPRWQTVEGFALGKLLARVPSDTPVLIDAIDTWVSQRAYELGLDQEDCAHPHEAMDVIIGEATALGAAMQRRVGITMVIAGVPGVGMVPLGTITRRLVDLHGKVTQALQPDLVTWVHAGRVLAQG